MNPNLVYLAQTDTTVGFLSQDKDRLYEAKMRSGDKPFLIAADSFATLGGFSRIPKTHRKFIRNSKKTTFAYPNSLALRVCHDPEHNLFLSKFKWMYSTSANKSGENFDLYFANGRADVVICDKRGLFEGESSKIFKLSKVKKRRLR